MELTGERLLPLPREQVWNALNDPEVLKLSVPGCESLERIDDTHYKVIMTAAVGPVKARFNGKLTLTDLRAPESYSLTFEGSGGAAGFGKGSAKVQLAPEGNGTRLVYEANAKVGGRLAQVGARLIDGVAKKMAEQFFERFTNALTPQMPQDTTDNEMASVAQDASSGHGATKQAGSKPWLWGAIGVAIVAILVYQFY